MMNALRVTSFVERALESRASDVDGIGWSDLPGVVHAS